MLVNGFLLIRGHFCQPSVYEGRPFAVVRADATTTDGRGEGDDADDREELHAHAWMMPCPETASKRAG